MILDTGFVIDLMEGLSEATIKMKEIRESRESIFVSTPTIFELWTGVAQSNWPECEKQKVKEVIESQLILDLTKTCAEEAGMMNGKLWKEGRPIDPEDCMIAGIAKHHDEAILTRNIKHFGRIPGIQVKTY